MTVLLDPLPGEGLLCVEASAGTGKTHLLSSLATRWLVEGDDVVVSNLLVVTYTVAAAAELRSRIRQHLAGVVARLGEAGAPGDDAYLEALAQSPDRAAMLARATRALADYDTAMIRTIHAFAASALDIERRAGVPAEDLRLEAVADVLSAHAFDADSPLWKVRGIGQQSIDEALSLRLDCPDVVVAPLSAASAGDGGAIAHREAVDDALERFKHRQLRDGAHTYADLLTNLERELSDDGSRVLRSLRARYRIGLIDEFQDTDPIQWRIFQRLFLGVPGRTLVVVGDPKQAIYGFRGADVSTYLAARSAAEDTASGGLGVRALGDNHRSDQALLDAVNGLFDGSHFDEANEIGYRPVLAVARNTTRRVTDEDGELVAPLALRVLTYGENAYAKRRAIAAACADEAVRSLGLEVRDEAGAPRRLVEDDVVVICAKRQAFPLLKEEFLRRGIRTTEARSDDVLDSPAALQVEVLLRALRDTARAGAVAALAHSWFGATNPEGAALDVVRARLASWETVLDRHGVAALGRAVTAPDVATGPLRGPGSERHLTDVQHLFDLLTVQAQRTDGPAVLLELLAELRGTDREGGDEDTRARRIDTDAPAVRLMTVHGAKGLEFGVVLCPFLQRTIGPRGPVLWREPDGQRYLDAGGGAEWTDATLAATTPEQRAALADAEDGGETRRLLYVALTRAKHRCVVWWSPAHDRPNRRRDELAGLLFDRDEHGRPRQVTRAARAAAEGDCYEVGRDKAAGVLESTFASLRADGLLEVGVVRAPQAPRHLDATGSRAAMPPVDLAVATLDRSLAVRDLRCSFSSLIGGTRHDLPAAEVVDEGGAGDEGPLLADAPRADDDPFGGLAGPTFGTAVHEALEAAVTRDASETFEDVLRRSLAEQLAVRSLQATDVVADGLLAATTAQIGDGPSIAQLTRDDVATELWFTIPVAEGVDVAAIGACLAANEPDGAFAEWAASLAAERPSRALAGSLVGSIDLVTTLGTGERYVVIDYKTNLVPGPGGYGSSALLGAMRAADYPLQAVLYLVALHRYLRWRLVGYDPEVHLGGAHYLFLRGMRAGTGDGVCTWTPSGAAVAALSDLLAGCA